MVFLPEFFRRFAAAATTRRISATLLSTPLSLTNLACVISAIICASVVFPVPGGPERITEGNRSASIARRKSFPGARMCSWPTNSSSERGRMRAASGALESPCFSSASISSPAKRSCTGENYSGERRLPACTFRQPAEKIFAGRLPALPNPPAANARQYSPNLVA